MTDVEIRIVRNDKVPADRLELLDGAMLFDPDSLDAAIVGVQALASGECVAVYNYKAIVDQYLRDGGSSLEDEDARLEVEEFVDFNTLRAVPYMGERSPIIVSEVRKDEPPDEIDPDDPPVYLTLQDKKWLVVESAHDLSFLSAS